MGKVDLKVGYSCNDACIHCVVDDFRDALRQQHQKQDKTLEALKQELLEARPLCEQTVITGGEPTLRPDFVELMQFAGSLGYRILVQTNGRRFSDLSLVEQVSSIPDTSYCIALHGPTAPLHEAITQRSGSFNETVAGITNLLNHGQQVVAKIVLSKLNFAHVPEICQLLLDLRVRSVSIAFPHAQGRARKLWEQVVPRYSEVAPYVRAGIRSFIRAGASADAETMPFCHMHDLEGCVAELFQQLEDYVQLNQYGSSRGIEDWSQVRPQIKEKFPQCRRCRFDAVCEGPWNEYAHRYGGEEFVPVLGPPILHPQEVLSGTFRQEFPLTYRRLP